MYYGDADDAALLMAESVTYDGDDNNCLVNAAFAVVNYCVDEVK